MFKKAFAKSVSPTEREIEITLNVVDILCSCMLDREAQNSLREHKMTSFLKEMIVVNGYSRFSAIKLIDYFVQNNKENAKDIVENDLLKGIFSYFMEKGINNKKTASLVQHQSEYMVNCLSAVKNLIKYTSGVTFDRVFFKFKENECEKISKTVELLGRFKISKEEFIVRDLKEIIKLVSLSNEKELMPRFLKELNGIGVSMVNILESEADE